MKPYSEQVAWSSIGLSVVYMTHPCSRRSNLDHN